MHIALLSKKIRIKPMNSKGLSSIVGSIFMMLIVGTLASAYFFSTLSQNTTYNQAIRQINNVDLARMAENVQALNTSYLVNSNGTVTVNAKLQNIGSSTVKLVNLWVHVIENPGGAALNAYNFTPVNISLQAGAPFQHDFNIPVTGVLPSGSYAFSAWFITDKGNTITLQQVNNQEIMVSQTTQGIGALAMDFQEFRYYTVTTNSLNNFPTGSSGYTVTTGTGMPVAFKIILTNLNYQSKNDIILYPDSVFFSIFPTSEQQVRGSYWYIINVNAQTGAISNTFTNVVLHYNVPTTVYFASIHAIKGAAVFGTSTPGYTGTSPINLALIGTKDGQPFGQNIPFVSISVS